MLTWRCPVLQGAEKSALFDGEPTSERRLAALERLSHRVQTVCMPLGGVSQQPLLECWAPGGSVSISLWGIGYTTVAAAAAVVASVVIAVYVADLEWLKRPAVTRLVLWGGEGAVRSLFQGAVQNHGSVWIIVHGIV